MQPRVLIWGYSASAQTYIKALGASGVMTCDVYTRRTLKDMVLGCVAVRYVRLDMISDNSQYSHVILCSDDIQNVAGLMTLRTLSWATHARFLIEKPQRIDTLRNWRDLPTNDNLPRVWVVSQFRYDSTFLIMARIGRLLGLNRIEGVICTSRGAKYDEENPAYKGFTKATHFVDLATLLHSGTMSIQFLKTGSTNEIRVYNKRSEQIVRIKVVPEYTGKTVLTLGAKFLFLSSSVVRTMDPIYILAWFKRKRIGISYSDLLRRRMVREFLYGSLRLRDITEYSTLDILGQQSN